MKKNNKKIEKISGVLLDYTFYDGLDIYNEGDETEDFLLKVFKEDMNVDEVLLNDDRYQIIYQLAYERAFIAEPMDINKSDDVLEIGSGMGAVTGALAKKAKNIDCIDLSDRRCQINAYRNKGFDNITIYVGNFEKIKLNKKYDVIVLIGVFEYASLYIKETNPQIMFLNRIKELLKPEGKLYIAIENRLGLKYFAGSVEDHLGNYYSGIEGYRQGDSVRTYSKSEIESLLIEAGFHSFFFYYPFPDYKLPRIIFSDAYLPNSNTTFPADGDYMVSPISTFNRQNVIDSLVETDEFKIFANSFLIEVSKG